MGVLYDVVELLIMSFVKIFRRVVISLESLLKCVGSSEYIPAPVSNSILTQSIRMLWSNEATSVCLHSCLCSIVDS